MQRVFFGIPVDQTVQQQIADLLKPFRGSLKTVRWVAPQNWHMTLAFLGNRPDALVEELTRSMDKAYQQVLGFKTGHLSLSRFPNSSGSIIALVLKADSQLVHLYKVTQTMLAANGFEISRTQFRPHITLGRLRKNSRLENDLHQQTNLNLQVGKVTFYQSTLTPSGSIYLALKEIKLNTQERFSFD